LSRGGEEIFSTFFAGVLNFYEKKYLSIKSKNQPKY